MNLVILASFTILLIVTTVQLRIDKRREGREDKEFWDRESAANNVRRKSLEDLPYVHIPWDTLPVEEYSSLEGASEVLEELHALENDKAVNLSGYTNTDLKMEYGTATITELTRYDDNYAQLAKDLEIWAEALLGAGDEEGAIKVFEFAISTDTDVIDTYLKLADLYTARGDLDKIHRIREQAEGLRSGSGKTIARLLKERFL